MEVDNLNSDVAKELLTVLYYCDDEFIDNIPNEVLGKINDLAAFSGKDYYIFKNKTLIEQDLSLECQKILAVLYFKYCLDDKEYQEMLELYETN